MPADTDYVGWYDGDTKYEAEATITVENSDIAVVAKTKGTMSAVVSINYKDETLSTTAAMEYRTDNGNTWTACTDDMAASTFGWNGSKAVTVQFRTGSTATTTASDAQSVTIPARPAAPAGITAQNETITGLGDGQLTGTTEAMEYSTDGETWTPCTAT